MKKLLIIPFLLFPSISYSKTKKQPYKHPLSAKVDEYCKNWETLEDRPQKEVVRCLKAIITRDNEAIMINKENIQQIYDAF